MDPAGESSWRAADLEILRTRGSRVQLADVADNGNESISELARRP
jgi:hypothetical protein